jgi:hypothetical protein
LAAEKCSTLHLRERAPPRAPSDVSPQKHRYQKCFGRIDRVAGACASKLRLSASLANRDVVTRLSLDNPIGAYSD